MPREIPKFKPTTNIGQLDLPPRCKAKLDNLEVHTIGEVAKVDFIVLCETVGFGTAKTLLKYVRQAGLTPTLQSPTWGEAKWRDFVHEVVKDEILDWKEVALAICGELNPPQVGTAVASNSSFQKHYPRGKTMQAVMEWFYAQKGRCALCGTRLFLEADHKKSKQEFRDEGHDPTEADTLGNLQLLCKRCNVVKRPSHDLGGLSFAPAQAVLMWILLALKPRNREEFYRLCRAHGLTMASVRFDEAWAFAHWLAKEGKYELD